jgi:hypothetical protein
MANGYIMLPGTVHNETDELYRIVEGSFDDIAQIDDEFIHKHQKKKGDLLAPKITKATMSPSSVDLDNKMALLPYQGLSLDQKYSKITLDRRSLIESRSEYDDYSEIDWKAISACLYAGMSEDEVIELAHRHKNGLGARHYVKGKFAQGFQYLREEYQRALSGFNVDLALNTANRHERLANARKAKANKPSKSPEEKAYASIKKQFEKRNLSTMTWRHMTNCKIFKSKKRDLSILISLVNSGKLKWVKVNSSVELV